MNNSPTDIDMEDCSHRGTAVWIKLLSKQRVLAAGKERACSGNETLKRVARRLEYVIVCASNASLCFI